MTRTFFSSMLKQSRLPLALSAVALLGASCSVSFQAQRPDGGVYSSANQGSTWQQAVFLSQTKDKLVTIGGLTITSLLFSPLDSNSLYAVAQEGALYESRNGGEQWVKLYSGHVQGIALHPKLRDVIYLASGNQVLQTTDGGQNWQGVYLEGTPSVTMTDVRLDSLNPSVLYASTSAGALLKSSDAGHTWAALHTFDKRGIKRVLVNAFDSRIVYVVANSDTLWRTGDGGTTWVEVLQRLKDQLKLDTGTVREVVALGNRPDGLLLASTYGLLRSLNGGGSWERLHLLTPPNSVGISALGVNPANEQVMYYSAGSAFYRTIDGGKDWQTVPLPAPHPATALGVQPPSAAVLYLGFGR